MRHERFVSGLTFCGELLVLTLKLARLQISSSSWPAVTDRLCDVLNALAMRGFVTNGVSNRCGRGGKTEHSIVSSSQSSSSTAKLRLDLTLQRQCFLR